MVIPITAI